MVCCFKLLYKQVQRGIVATVFVKCIYYWSKSFLQVYTDIFLFLDMYVEWVSIGQAQLWCKLEIFLAAIIMNAFFFKYWFE